MRLVLVKPSVTLIKLHIFLHSRFKKNLTVERTSLNVIPFSHVT